MKTLIYHLRKLFAVLFLFFSYSLFAQNKTTVLFESLLAAACDSTPANCVWNLKDSNIYNVIGAIEYPNEVHYGKHSSSWKDVEDSIDITQCAIVHDQCHQGNDIVNGQNFDDSSLKYFVYYPLHHRYNGSNGCKLPALIMFHGGGYSDCGTIDGPDIKFICQEFAKKGFVVFDIEYRRGVLLDQKNGNYASVQGWLALYRACQDARGAVRSIIKREQNHSTDFPNDPYRIDINNIFIGGASAGSIIALHTAYFTSQSIINLAFPTGINSNNVLGSINQDYYYGDTTIDYQSKIKGVLNMWGQIYLPYGSTIYNIPGSSALPPMISFQGKQDQLVIPDSARIYNSPSAIPHTQFNNTNQCLLSSNTFSIEGVESTPDKTGWGTITFTDYLKLNNVPVERYIDCQGDHGLEFTDDPSDPTGRNYGTSWISTVNDAQTYIAQRASIFFQAVLGSYAGSLHDINFIECENYRHGCSTSDNNANCHNTDTCTTQ